MRRAMIAAAVGVLLTVPAGCPANLPLPGPSSVGDEPPGASPSGAGSSEEKQSARPAPPPPPPPPSPPPSPELLARQALEAPTRHEQEVAAVRLTQLGNPAKEHARRVLSESRSPEVRAACIRGLAVLWDYHSMPVFLDALEDESELVRSRAGEAVQRMMSVDLGYRSDDAPEQRADAAERFREHWEEFRKSEVFKNWKERLQEAQRQGEQQPPEGHP